MFQNKTAYQLPEICCRCGEKQGASRRQIRASRVMDLGYYVAIISVKKSNYSFYVPLCVDCSNTLDRYDKVNKSIKGVSIILLIPLGVYLFILIQSLVFSALLTLVTYVFLGAMFFNRGENGYGLGGFTGRYFWFSNRKFFKQFAELNPQLVDPQYTRNSSSISPATDSTQSGFIWNRSNIILLFVLLVCFFCCVLYCWLVYAVHKV